MEEIPNMLKREMTGRRPDHKLALATIMLGSTLVASTAALAGECPADKFRADVRQPVSHAAKGVTDTVLAAIDLGKERAKLAERHLRLRKLTIEPGGIVPWHSHGDRPAIIYIAEGEIVEFASNCSVPIVHKAGDVAKETSGTSHWWQNNGTKTVILFSSDVLHDKNDKHM
jgi:quercetin dioxygenase-like cupin family protein